ncbi:ABC transporter permease [Aeromonas schubertii]|uniref:ABC transporter permease n=1 Tax=Aeromonas schubertii TaxID=652 RepID=UPI0038B53D15
MASEHLRPLALITTLLLLGLPLLAGLGALLPALRDGAGWSALLAAPGLATSLLLTLGVSLGSTLFTLLLTFALLAHGWESPPLRRLERWLSPLLALPHVAFAVGLAFLVAPSGWLLRLPAQLLGWSLPPDWQTLRDPLGLGLTLALTLKELPFLLLMALAALRRHEVTRQLHLGQSLGFSPAQVWWRLLLPALWPKIRLPLAAIAAYGCGVVDLPLLLGPDAPPVLAQRLWLWSREADLSLHRLAHQGALLLLSAALLLLALLRWLEYLACQGLRHRQLDGHRRPARARRWPAALTGLLLAVNGAILLALLLWSVTRRWRFPDLFPTHLSSLGWQEALPTALPLLGTTLALALVTTWLAALWALLVLESERRPWPLWLLCLPLLLPQASLLIGLDQALAYLDTTPGIGWVVWGQLLFVFPYVYLCLRGPWHSFDERLILCARALGASPWRAWWRIKLPLLARPLLAALAVGVAVSLAQYLPTLLLGGGRVMTLTTEAVAIGSGLNRRLAGLYALLQLLIPLAAFLLALWLPGRINPLERRPC